MTYLLVVSDSNQKQKRLCQIIRELTGKNIENLSIANRDPDIHMLKNQEEKQSIGIEQIQNLILQMSFQPYNSTKQLAIIDNAQLLTTEAQNALLKTLEEHSISTDYILIVNNPKNLLKTILSRCQILYPPTQQTKQIDDNKSIIKQFLSLPLYEQLLQTKQIVTGREKFSLEDILTFLIVKQSEKVRNIKNIEVSEYLLKAEKRLKLSSVNKQLLLENILITVYTQ